MSATTTAAFSGKDGAVKVGTAALGYVDTWSLTISQDVADIKKLGSMWGGAQGTGKKASGSMGGTLVSADTATLALATSMLTDTEARADLHLVLSATKEFTGSAVISDFQMSDPAAGVVTWTASFTFDGAPTEGTPA